MPHLILLGDSIFDNAAYVGAGPAVITQVRRRLPDGWRATLAAIDGSTTQEIPAALAGLPEDVTHLALSVGGNNALLAAGLLAERVSYAAEGLARLHAAAAQFEHEYRTMLAAVLARRLPTLVCTVYNPRMPDPYQQRVHVAGLCLFNDAVIRVAAAAGLPLLDLRLICTEEADYANPIEPSSHGGAKIAAALVGAITAHSFEAGRSVIYTR